jgi:hypothetical protein
MTGKLVIRYEMDDDQIQAWAAQRDLPPGFLTAAIVGSVQACVEELLAGSPLAECATIQVAYR